MGALEIGFSIAGLVVVIIGSFLANNRYILNKISSGNTLLYQKIDETRAQYVRRDDLTSHIERLERGQAEMKEEQRRTNDRIDKVLAELVKDKP